MLRLPDASCPSACTSGAPSTLWGAAPRPPTPQLAPSTLLVIFFSLWLCFTTHFISCQ